MQSTKIEAGSMFPELTVNSPEGEAVDIGKPTGGADWRMVVIYRGRHCPLCTRFLNRLEAFKGRLSAIGIDLAVVSGDNREQLEDYLDQLNISYPIYYGLSIGQMKQLGVYISNPRSPEETDHPFAEPGLFVINDQGQVQVVDISNNPFVRPELEGLVSGLEWIRQNSYPIRGTYSY